jgi:hypothetical protein
MSEMLQLVVACRELNFFRDSSAGPPVASTRTTQLQERQRPISTKQPSLTLKSVAGAPVL